MKIKKKPTAFGEYYIIEFENIERDDCFNGSRVYTIMIGYGTVGWVIKPQ